LEDLRSKNGTYVGRQRLESAHPLEDGDEIHVGSVRLVFRSARREDSTETGSRRR
jgi:pSer/pThr/pTyr-binding forkhead associated (FHA) protein